MYKGYTNVKIKSFFDQDTYGITASGGSYVSCKYAHEFAEEFINLPKINVLDIQVESKAVHVIYTDGK
jgi:hypothetical protein